MSALRTDLRGARLLVLNWRDVRHPQSGGAEQYMHRIATRWVQSGAHVTWLTARPAGQPASEVIDGVHVMRAGSTLSVYARTAARLLRSRGHFDAVVDCQNGIPFFAPLFVGSETPVVQVVHHVHQDQFATQFSRPMAAVGRFLEGPVARWAYGQRAIAAVSPSTRLELRRRLGFTGPVFVVPNGTDPVGPHGLVDRAPTPTIAVVSRLVPHKRLDLLLGHLATVADQVPDLQVEIAGDGPERSRLQALVADLGLQSTVRLHGRVSDEERDELMSRAWLTISTSAAEGWGCTVIEAAAWGVPCLALEVPGIRDSVLDGETGWLVEQEADFGRALVAAFDHLRDRDRAQAMAAACRSWAGCFSWDRSADLLGAVVLEEMRASAAHQGKRTLQHRAARSDMAVVVDFPASTDVDARSLLRSTDEVVRLPDRTSVVLSGCDEFDAPAVLARLGVREGRVRLADRRLLLAGPAAPPAPEVDGERLALGKLVMGRSA